MIAFSSSGRRVVGAATLVAVVAALATMALIRLRDARPEDDLKRADREESLGRITVPDVALVDQHKHLVNLRRDLAPGHVLVVNFVYTACTTICPPLGASFERLQKLLGPRAGRDVRLVSITLDPVNDTPERLEEWGQRFGAGPGWSLLGGTRSDVDDVLRRLNVYTAAKESHAPMVLVGNAATGDWVRTYGLPTPARLLAIVDRMSPPAGTAAAGRSAVP